MVGYRCHYGRWFNRQIDKPLKEVVNVKPVVGHKNGMPFIYFLAVSDICKDCHDLERILRVPDFFVIFIKHGFYYSGSGAQVLIVIYFKLH